MRILVTGGSGVVGRPAIDRLLQRGHTVRLLSRHAEHAAGEWEAGVEAFPAHVGDAAAMRGAAAGCQAVLHVAGVVAEDPPEVTFQRVNVEGTRHVLAEAARAGVERLVFVSSLGADRGASDYHRSKRAAEELVRGYGGSWLILRPGNVYGPGDHVFSLLLKAVRALPAVPVVGGGEQPFQPIWAEDLAEALALAVEGEHSGEALDIAGTEVTTTNQVLDLLEELTGRHPPRLPVPDWIAEAGAELAEALGVDTPVHSDQLVMLEEGNVIPPGRPNALTALFGLRPLPLAEGLARLADGLPERMPMEGTGRLHRHRYWADIRGGTMDAEALLRMTCESFAELPARRLLQVGTEPGSGARLAEGKTVTLSIPLRGNVQVRVEEVTPGSVTAVTLEGHPLSGTIRFLSEPRDDGCIRYEIRTYTRPSSLLDRITMQVVGEPVKDAVWRSVVQEVVRRSGGEAPEGVQARTDVLDDAAVADLEQWVERLVRGRRRREAEADANRRG